MATNQRNNAPAALPAHVTAVAALAAPAAPATAVAAPATAAAAPATATVGNPMPNPWPVQAPPQSQAPETRPSPHNESFRESPAPKPRPVSYNDCFWLCILCAVIIIVTAAAIIGFLKHRSGDRSQSKQSWPKFYVASINVSSFKVSRSQITGNWDMVIRVDNNGTALHYDNVQVSVSYEDQLLLQTAINPFNVAPEDHIMLQARLGASQNISNQVASSIITERAQEAVNFNVKLQATEGRISGRKYGEVRESTRVYCRDMKVEFSSHTNIGTMLGGPSPCKVQV